jgi:hypothetical protein
VVSHRARGGTHPCRYAHVWLGDYARAFEGAYFASVLAQARQEGRIEKVSADPILPLRLFWDIAFSGSFVSYWHKADSLSRRSYRDKADILRNVQPMPFDSTAWCALRLLSGRPRLDCSMC